MSVFVTGANGFLGRRVVERLLARGQTDIRCLVRQQSQRDSVEALAHSAPGARVECLVGDLRSPETYRSALDGVDTIYHLAAAMKGSFSDMVMGTVVGSRYLLDEAAANAPTARMVLVSSFAVYGTAQLPAGATIDEDTPLEHRPVERGPYGWTKLRQERLFRDVCRATGQPLVVIRPGVVYGPGGVTFSPRVGVQLPGAFLHVGGSNVIPFTYVDNCAEAIALAGSHPDGAGKTLNVVDDDLLTSAQYLHAFRRRVKRIRYLYVPYPVMRVVADWVEGYHRRSRGQLPAFFTRYKADSNWKGCTFTNAALKALGWKQLVATGEGMERTFRHLREITAEESGS
jgi:nucleoside-diphosphate-sugar epimerase